MHKCYDVTIENYVGCSSIYFVVMLTISLGGHGAWVECKHLYYILQNMMYYGKTKKFIHYPRCSLDEVQHLLVQANACES
jgi:hypothetical protein